MERLIDANALMERVYISKHDNPHKDSRLRANHINEHNHFFKLILESKTVNAVEVVCCKDCAWYENGKDYEPYCNHPTHGIQYPSDYDFCSYGVRKDGDGNG